jgi:hypothetical protein
VIFFRAKMNNGSLKRVLSCDLDKRLFSGIEIHRSFPKGHLTVRSNGPFSITISCEGVCFKEIQVKSSLDQV